MKIIGHIQTDFSSKFGIPRQSGLVPELKGIITFEPEFRNPQAFRGLEEFSHIWILWKFSKSEKEHWSATVKPPRLGGKKRMGVFATRSPYRPNDIGLSSVKLEKIKEKELQVDFPEELLSKFPKEKRDAILGVLSQDPRPAYDTDETRLYGVEFAGFDVRFTVTGELLQVKELIKLN